MANTSPIAQTGTPLQRAPRQSTFTGVLAEGGTRALWLAVQALLWFFCFLVVFPLLWTVLTSLKTSRELFTSTWGLPATPQWANYARAWEQMQVGSYIFNSIGVSAMSIVFIMLLSSMIAYVLARYQFRGNRFLFFYFIAGMMVPGFLGMIPAWFLHRSLARSARAGG